MRYSKRLLADPVGTDAQAELQRCRAILESRRARRNADGLTWARRIVARHNAGERLAPLTLQMARDALARCKGPA